ncbi:MAG: 3-phosphoserine/phosphohydroxythreonine transaminase [Ectothiorhodospiraceae bacterium]|nr:3-phosphoserine/phosphohydroxythreonine transaminase [Chromatiales bacterium]MCP5156889.1 3-phosphoserine/phosphohydroxythreonine transaminase [Ectothiorhodospiraceae bacterium]
MATRHHNFAAGPSALPLPVLERIRADLPEYDGTGMAVLELNHRGREFMALAARAEARLRRVMDVPDDYAVLFLHGPARLQFSAVPLNLLGDAPSADYVEAGLWSEMAITEARRLIPVNVVASSKARRYTTFPRREDWKLDPRAAFVHYTPNETIGGLEVHEEPDTGDVPLVVDMSSNILSRPVDVRRYGAIYAGAQKNAGIPGLVLVVVRRDLLGRASPTIPRMLDWTHAVEESSLANTAPTFAWYVADLMLEWLEAEGGVAEMEARNARKAKSLYDVIDGSNFYANPVDPVYRSRMNIPFTLAEPALEPTFLAEARDHGLVGLQGHRYVGGMRASLYNAITESEVDALADFMRDFARRRA